MATNNGSPHLQIRQFEWFISRPLEKWLHPIVIAFNTLCPVQFYFQWCVTLHWTHWGSYFEKLICPCLGSQFFKKLPQLVAIQNFQSSHLSHGESLNHNILSHYHQTHIEHIFENIIYITRKTPNLVLYQTDNVIYMTHCYTLSEIIFLTCGGTLLHSYISLLRGLQIGFTWSMGIWRKQLHWVSILRTMALIQYKDISSYQYRKSHCGDKTVVRSSYLHNGISYAGKITSLYWIRALTLKCEANIFS